MQRRELLVAMGARVDGQPKGVQTVCGGSDAVHPPWPERQPKLVVYVLHRLAQSVRVLRKEIVHPSATLGRRGEHIIKGSIRW